MHTAPMRFRSACHRYLVVRVAFCLSTLHLASGSDRQRCVSGQWDGDSWQSEVALPNASQTTQCLHSVQFLGGSTVRELYSVLTTDRNLTDIVKGCDLSLGYGCYECRRGCHNPRMHSEFSCISVSMRLPLHVAKLSEKSLEHKRFAADVNPGPRQILKANWKDLYTEVGLSFSWKPEMFTVDDVVRLQHLATQAHPSVFIVHKGTHDAHNWVEAFSEQVSSAFFEQEMVSRAQHLIRFLQTNFPSSTILWRETYYNHRFLEIEVINAKLTALIAPVLQHAGIFILPGYNITRGVPKNLRSHDGIHQQEYVKRLILAMAACVVCNDTYHGE